MAHVRMRARLQTIGIDKEALARQLAEKKEADEAQQAKDE